MQVITKLLPKLNFPIMLIIVYEDERNQLGYDLLFVHNQNEISPFLNSLYDGASANSLESAFVLDRKTGRDIIGNC